MAWKELNEADWQKSNDGLNLVLQCAYGSRQGLLIVAACLRRSPQLFRRGQRGQPIVTVDDVENMADGLPSAFDPIKERVSDGMCNGDRGFVVVNVSPVPGGERIEHQEEASAFEIEGSCEEATVAWVIRDIVPNPFRPTSTIDAAWLTWNDATISRLAQKMYDSHDFSSMPILADALEEAGCTSADILDHCRGSGPHVRGCWVVDLLLGKE